MNKPPKWIKDYELVKTKPLNYHRGLDDQSFTFVPTYTQKTDDFGFVKEAAYKGNLIDVRLVWSWKYFKWMYKYKFIWTPDSNK